MKHLFTLTLFAVLCNLIVAQTPDFSISPKADSKSDIDEFDYSLLEEIILVKINQERYAKNLNLLKERLELKETALDMANSIAFPEGSKTSLGECAIAHGGTRYVSEYSSKCSIKAGADMKTYRQIADELLSKWNEQASANTDLMSDFNLFIGIASTVNYENGRLVASIVLGNNSSFAIKLNDNAKQYISAKTAVLPYDEKLCKKVPQLDELYELNDGLKVTKDQVTFETNNIKLLKRFIKNEDDGLMLDVLQYAQYDCNSENIIDMSQVHKGLVGKPVYTFDIFANGKGAVSVKLGSLPKSVTNNYELNLIVINKGHACRNIYKTTITLPEMKDVFNIDFMTYKDPKFVNETRISYKDIPEKMDRDFCWRAESKYYQTEFNTYNCILTKLKYSSLTAANELYKVNSQIDMLYGKPTINQDTLKLLDIAIQLKVIGNSEFDETTRKQSYDRLTAIEMPKLSEQNQRAMIGVYMQQKDYLRAITLLDALVLDKNVSEDLLFSYISLCSLYKERVLSGTFAKAIEKAEEMNNERLCMMFEEGKLSRQMFENFKVKDLYCEKCTIDHSIR